nr:ROK family protein [uncultured Cohaesibacter sp.]
MQTTAGKILTVLRDQGPCSRADLARNIGLSTAAMSKFAAELLNSNIVREVDGTGKQSVGRPSIDLALNPETFLMIGAHITIGRVEIVLTDSLMKILETEHFEFDLEIDIDDLIGKLAGKIDVLVSKSGFQRSRFRGVGLTVPGAVDDDGRVNLFSVFSQWSNIAFADLLEEQLNLPVTLEHNAAAIALAESRFGAGRDKERVLYVYMGGGIGAGITYSRERSNSLRRCRQVELGHIVVDPHGAHCRCGKDGCLETLFSEGPLLKFLGCSSVPKEGLIEALMQTDFWLERYEHFLQILATSSILLLPDMIVLGGHFGAAPDTFFEKLEQDLIPRVTVPQHRAQLSVVRTSYLDEAGAVGAACAGLEQFIFGDPLQAQGRSRQSREIRGG